MPILAIQTGKTSPGGKSTPMAPIYTVLQAPTPEELLNLPPLPPPYPPHDEEGQGNQAGGEAHLPRKGLHACGGS